MCGKCGGKKREDGDDVFGDVLVDSFERAEDGVPDLDGSVGDDEDGEGEVVEDHESEREVVGDGLLAHAQLVEEEQLLAARDDAVVGLVLVPVLGRQLDVRQGLE